MPWSAAIFEKKKKEFFIKLAIFPVKKQATEAILTAELWDKSWNSFILEKIRIIEFCSFDHLNYDVFIRSGTRGIGMW